VAAGEMQYLDLGSAKKGTCLLVHGSYGSWKHWIANVADLSQNFRVLAPDLPGFGRSSNVAQSANLQFFADSLAQLLISLEISTISLIGFSFGALVATELTLSVPHLVETLCVISPPVESMPNPIVASIQAESGRLALHHSLDASVGRSRYAEESPAAPRTILHAHPLDVEGLIVQYFVRINQHDDNQYHQAL
jgi:pimeloyl-ACP methyl ester carboxylesterase